VAPAHTFGRYRVSGTLGIGAMGEVYSAVDEVLGREVAVKTLKSASGFTAHMLDDRFRQEARAIAQLSHPGIVQVFDIDLAADPPYLVMERVAGPTLGERMKQGLLPASELIPLGIQIARALSAAHGAGIVHRDIKPANILGAGPTTWKLADFGVAHVPDSSLTITGQFVGSPAYAAPEALVKGVSAPPGDIYSLGATLYEAAAGKWPRGESAAALLAPVPPLAELVPALPRALCAAIDRAVAFEAPERPTASELAELLAHAAIDPEPAPAPAPAPAPGPRGIPWRTWGIAVAVALAMIGIVVATRHSDPPAALPSADLADTPREITATPPPNLSGKAARDWNHLVDELERGHFDGARHKLDDFERKYGATPETQSLRDQLDALPPDEPHGPPHDPHRKHEDD
jgi:serine/threonine-protein kinase